MNTDRQPKRTAKKKAQSERIMFPKTYSVASVASTILKLAKVHRKSLTNLRLQKILFFSHAFYINTTNHPLIDENFQNSMHGPILKDLFIYLSNYGTNPIRNINIHYSDIIRESDFTYIFLKKIWLKLEKHRTVKLVQFSKIIFNTCNNQSNSDTYTIDNEMIKKYFGENFN